jgi:hypothetical protein
MSSSSVSRGLALPALCAAAEATWLTVALGALVNGSSTAHHVALPYGALALPLVGAAVIAKALSRRPGPLGAKVAAVAAVAVVGAVLTAGLVAALSQPGLAVTTALHPWSLAGRPSAPVATAAWLVALLAWGRGTWLGTARIRLSDTVVSLSIGAAVFFLVVVVARDTHQAVVRRAIGQPAPLLILFLVLGALTLATLQRQQVEEATPFARPSGGTGNWLAMLAVPLVAVALVGLAVAALVGPVAPAVGHGVTAAADRVGSALAAAALWLWHLVVGKAQPVHRARIPVTGSGGPSRSSAGLPAWGRLTGLAVVVAVAIWQFIRWTPRTARWVRARRSTRARPEPELVERRTWSFHFGSPRAWARRLWQRLRPAKAGATAGPPPAPAPPLAPVRRSYRDVLAALARQGQGRGPTETVRELAVRLADRVPGSGEDVAALSALYEAARYSSGPVGPEDAERAEVAARALVTELEPEPLAGSVRPWGARGR